MFGFHKTKRHKVKVGGLKSLSFWLMNINATFALHSHGVVTQLLVQVVGGPPRGFACRQCHLDTGCFGTLCLAPGHGTDETRGQ